MIKVRCHSKSKACALMTTLIAAAVLQIQPGNAARSMCQQAGPMTQFGKIEICASSVLKSQGRNSYTPANASDGDSTTAWVEGAPHSGEGEWIEYIYDGPATIQTLSIVNGYAKSAKAFKDNARVRTFEIHVDDTTVFRGRLADTRDLQQIRLDRPVNGTIWRLLVLDVYPGRRWQDLAVSEFWADLEEHNYSAIEEPDPDYIGSEFTPTEPVAVQEGAQPAPSPAAPSGPSSIGRDDVLLIQVLLQQLGYDAGPPTGEVTQTLKSAIIAYQSVNGEVPDGQPSVQLKQKLTEHIQSQQ